MILGYVRDNFPRLMFSLPGLNGLLMSVQCIPTDEEKQRRREAAQLSLFNDRPEKWPLLHPLGSRPFPYERLCWQLWE